MRRSSSHPTGLYDDQMLTRFRWFIYGAATTVGATVLIVTRVRSLRERLDSRGVSRASVDLAADGIEFVGRRLQRSAIRVAPDQSSGPTG
jgi:hypothetical protein